MTEVTLKASDLNPSQRDLLRCRSPQVLFSGGFGSGKTTGIMLKALQLKSENPDVPGLIVAPNWRSMWGVSYRALREIMLRALGKHGTPKLRDRGLECFIDFGDSGPIFLRSANNTDGFDGLNVGWLVGDELRYWDRHAYEVAIGRVRVPCPFPQKAFASTPQMNWMSDIFANQTDADRVLITAPTKENLHNLSPNFIDDLRKSYSPRVQKALLDGEFTVMEGSVFEQFDAGPNSPWLIDWKPTEQDLMRKKVFLAVDPGYRKSAWIFIVERGPLDWVVFDELMLDNHSDEAAVAMVNSKKYPIDEIWTDPAADNTQSISALDTIGLLSKINTRSRDALRSVDVYRDIRFGVDKLRVLLGGYNDLPRRIHFSRHLLNEERKLGRGAILSTAALRYPEAKDGKPVTDLPLKDGINDHACLNGRTKIFTKNGKKEIRKAEGWQEILTPLGYRKALIGRTGNKNTYEIWSENNVRVIATGDHRFLVQWACGCKRNAAGVSWLTVLQIREVLLKTNKNRKKIPASGRLVGDKRRYSKDTPHPPQEPQQGRQLHRKPGANACICSLINAHEKESKGVHRQSKSSSGRVARHPGRERVAQITRERVLEREREDRKKVHRVREGLFFATQRDFEVLPPELQGHGASPKTRNKTNRRISSVTGRKKEDVWCASVEEAGCFTLSNGIISSNCDAIRYWAVGRWLCEPKLRQIDDRLKRDTRPGWKVYRRN